MSFVLTRFSSILPPLNVCSFRMLAASRQLSNAAFIRTCQSPISIRDAVSLGRKRRDSSALHMLEEMSLPYDPIDEAIRVHAVDA